ncbi:MAG: hypothetical protein KBT46_09460, partial [Ruminococcus sp.]|nr:hypothetical protein [Candidatus Copronaster equi]
QIEGVDCLNPFKVSRIIRDSKNEGKKLSIDDLSVLCEGRVRHLYVRMSRDTFECESSGGFPRHRVIGLRPTSYITMWFYKPSEIKIEPVTPIDESELEEPQDIR